VAPKIAPVVVADFVEAGAAVPPPLTLLDSEVAFGFGFTSVVGFISVISFSETALPAGFL
jgi:hypothetical protein